MVYFAYRNRKFTENTETKERSALSTESHPGEEGCLSLSSCLDAMVEIQLRRIDRAIPIQETKSRGCPPGVFGRTTEVIYREDDWSSQNTLEVPAHIILY